MEMRLSRRLNHGLGYAEPSIQGIMCLDSKDRIIGQFSALREQL